MEKQSEFLEKEQTPFSGLQLLLMGTSSVCLLSGAAIWAAPFLFPPDPFSTGGHPFKGGAKMIHLFAAWGIMLTLGGLLPSHVAINLQKKRKLLGILLLAVLLLLSLTGMALLMHLPESMEQGVRWAHKGLTFLFPLTLGGHLLQRKRDPSSPIKTPLPR